MNIEYCKIWGNGINEVNPTVELVDNQVRIKRWQWINSGLWWLTQLWRWRWNHEGTSGWKLSSTSDEQKKGAIYGYLVNNTSISVVVNFIIIYKGQNIKRNNDLLYSNKTRKKTIFDQFVHLIRQSEGFKVIKLK